MKNIKFISIVLFFCFALLLGQNASLDVKKISPRTTLSVIKRVEQEYYLLTKNIPIELSVSGPTSIRVYSRLLWHNNMTDSQPYKLIIRQADQDKVLSFITEKSKSTYDANKQSYGKWRSFYLDIPAGLNNYKLTLLEAQSETVAVRFNFEKPKEYKKSSPYGTYRELQFVENEKVTNYHELKLDEPVKIKIEGPLSIKAVCRINYDYTLEGKQNFTLATTVQGKEWRTKTFRVSKSETGMYKNAPELIPSTPVNFFINVPPGTYIIDFNLKGTLAKTAGISFYSKPLELYE
jgi:hypothetical protein